MTCSGDALARLTWWRQKGDRNNLSSTAAALAHVATTGDLIAST